MIYAYSDGACKGNPGPGGWGSVVKLSATDEIEIKGFESYTTNNKMELTASIEALKVIPKGESVLLTTDSKYVIEGITKWIMGWKKKGWKSAGGGEVKNIDLWKALDVEVSCRNVKFEWVRGHTGHPDNERCDALANEAITSGRVELSKIPGNATMSFDM